jgi:spectinomycin phosphotransferase
VFRVSKRPVVVSRFVDGITDFPTGLGKREKEKLASAASELHQATVTAPVPRETFELFFAEELDHALAAIASRTDSGPLGNDAARLVQRNEQRIAEWRAEIGDLQMNCRAAHGDFVLTHGEPDQPNVMVTRERDLLLLDWGDLLWAPSERDARGLANAGIAAPGRPRVKRFYELRWILGEIAEYLARLSAPHTGDAEDHRARRELDRYLV